MLLLFRGKIFLRKNKKTKGEIPMTIITPNEMNIGKELRKLRLKAKFNDKNVTTSATFIFLELFKKIIGWIVHL